MRSAGFVFSCGLGSVGSVVGGGVAVEVETSGSFGSDGGETVALASEDGSLGGSSGVEKSGSSKEMT